MKASMVSSTAPVALVASSPPIKAERPQQLKSVTVYWRGRKMVLMQRPQRRLSVLLCRMLRRSMQSLFGTLIGTLANKGKRALGTAALATGALASMSAYAGITSITLPVNGTVQSGAAAISTVGNQMTVTQATDKAIIDWQSFSIGSKAGVNFIQNNANSVALNRVTGNDPSLIMGSLTANGKLFLVNAAGILVGKHAKIDVAGFVASTLNISNADFLAGKMNFAAEAGKHIGNVKNKGEITVHDGGSVYLIGANVENDGIINAPNGEVLLAAGRVVKLIDTTLPGVSIDVGGIAGKVTNLGRIMASAGTVGIGAALIDNSGTINASSVTKEGGRIFLRASQDLTTSSTSMINADGTVGGNVVLYADHSANIDGDVSALGNVDGKGGKGGYVDTSGKQQLSVMYKPRIGAGGEWFIDPHDVEIVSDAVAEVGATGTSAITANGDSAKIRASTITGQLNTGVSVTISTGTDGTQTGDITVSSAIVKNTGALATLTLDAAGSIAINDAISSTGGSGMNLVLVAHNGSISQTAALSVGDLTASAGTAITLNNAANQIGALTANNGIGDISVTSMGGSAITLNNISATNGNIIVNNTNNDIHIAGNLTANGAGKGIALTAGAGMLQSGGVISTGQLTANAGIDIDIDSVGNNVHNFTGASTTGHIHLHNTGNLTTFGNITVGAGKEVNLTTAGNLTVGGAGIAAQTISLTATSPSTNLANIAIGGQLTANDAISLHSELGTITQSAAISAASLSASGNSDITLDNTGNNFAAFTAGTGGNVVVKTSGALTIGSTSANNLTVTAGNGISMNGNIQASAGNVALTSTLGSITLGNVNAANLNVSANAGTVSQTWPTILTVSGELHAEAKNGITLDTNVSNQVGKFSANNSDNGNITFVNHTGVGDVLTLGKISNIHGNVAITNNRAIVQSSGVDTGISALALNVVTSGGMTLNAANNVGAFTATNTSSGDIALTTLGALTLSGDVVNSASTGNVTIIAGGNIVSTSTHGGGGVINRTASNGTVTLTSTNGNVMLGRVDAVDLAVNAHGLINQESTNTGGLTVTGTMNASAHTGITLDHSSGTCGTNHVANFRASNSDSGNITLVNVGAGNTLVQIHNAGGNISVNNEGALTTTGLIDASGSVLIATHSPLTIGAGGINAGTGLSLAAGDNSSVTDTMIVNGVIRNGGAVGSTTIVGNTVAMNAAVFGPRPVYSSPNPTVFGANYASNPVTVTPVVTTLVIAPPSTIDHDLVVTQTPPDSTVQTTPVSTAATHASDQTAGGSDGEFGGEKDDGKSGKNAKSSKALPVCS